MFACLVCEEIDSEEGLDSALEDLETQPPQQKKTATEGDARTAAVALVQVCKFFRALILSKNSDVSLAKMGKKQSTKIGEKSAEIGEQSAKIS